MQKLVIILLALILFAGCAALTDVKVGGRDGKESSFKAPSRDIYEIPKDPNAPSSRF